MAKGIAIKDEWIAAARTLPSRACNEVIGAIYLFLLTGEKPQASAPANSVLAILWPFVESAKKVSEVNRRNVSSRYTSRSGFVATTEHTTEHTAVATNGDDKKQENCTEGAPGADFVATNNIRNDERISEKETNGEGSPSLSPEPPILSTPRENNIIYNISTGGNKRVSKPKNSFSPELTFIENEQMRSVVQEWLDYKRKKGQSYKDDKSVRTMVNKLIKYSDGDASVAAEIISEAISNNYAGFFPLKNRQQYGQTGNYSRQFIGIGQGVDYEPDYSESSL